MSEPTVEARSAVEQALTEDDPVTAIGELLAQEYDAGYDAGWDDAMSPRPRARRPPDRRRGGVAMKTDPQAGRLADVDRRRRRTRRRMLAFVNRTGAVLTPQEWRTFARSTERRSTHGR